jgi:hypothetical protein
MLARHSGIVRTFVSVLRSCCETGTPGGRFTAVFDVLA